MRPFTSQEVLYQSTVASDKNAGSCWPFAFGVPGDWWLGGWFWRSHPDGGRCAGAVRTPSVMKPQHRLNGNRSGLGSGSEIRGLHDAGRSVSLEGEV